MNFLGQILPDHLTEQFVRGFISPAAVDEYTAKQVATKGNNPPHA